MAKTTKKITVEEEIKRANSDIEANQELLRMRIDDLEEEVKRVEDNADAEDLWLRKRLDYQGELISNLKFQLSSLERSLKLHTAVLIGAFTVAFLVFALICGR